MRVDGKAAAQLKAQLRGATPKARAAMYRAMDDAVQPLTTEFRQQARRLPSGGGLAEYIARAQAAVSRRLSGARPSLTVRMSRSKAGGSVDLPAVNAGRLRHPTYGRAPWQSQQVEPGLWDRTTERAGAKAQQRLLAAVRRAARDIAR